MKIQILDYSVLAIAVKGASAAESRFLEAKGLFNTRLKHNGETRPGWIFSAKRRDEVAKLAKSLKLKVHDYNPGKSIALFPALEPHQKALIEAGANYNNMLKGPDGNRFAGWVVSKKKQEQIIELCKSF